MTRLRAGLRRLLLLWLRLPVVVRAVAPVVVMVLLWLSSSKPPTPRAPSVLRALMHNGAHVVAFLGLGGAWLLALLSRAGGVVDGRAPSRRVIGASLLLTIGYGIVDEVHQAFVPGRHSSLLDVVSDALGGAIAAAFVLWVCTGSSRCGKLTLWLLLVAAMTVAAATWFPF